MQRCGAGADYLISIMVTLRYKKNARIVLQQYQGLCRELYWYLFQAERICVA